MLRFFLLCIGLLVNAFAVGDEPAETLGDVRSQIIKLNESLATDKQNKDALYQQLRTQSLKVSEISRALSETRQAIKDQDHKHVN